jgi:hypothetical protein
MSNPADMSLDPYRPRKRRNRSTLLKRSYCEDDLWSLPVGMLHGTAALLPALLFW